MTNAAIKSNVIPFNGSSAVVSARKAAKFITNIWGNQPGKYFFLDARDPGVKPGYADVFTRDEFDQIEDYIEANGDKNIWWCPHGFRKVSRRNKHGKRLPQGKARRLKKWVAKPRWLHADLDNVDPDNLIVPPTILYETSKGSFAGLWRMDKRTGFEMCQRVTYACGADNGGWMATKLLRVPYTINRKEGRKNATVRIVEGNGPEYTMESLDDALGLWARISEGGMKLLRRKYEAGDDRSEHRAKIVNKLVGEGFNDDQIYELFGNDNPWVSDYKKLMDDIKRLRKSYKGQRPAKAKPEVEITSAMDIEPEAISWRWEGVIPDARLMVIFGEPGLGKSQLTCRIASHVTRGKEWPDGSPCSKGDVYFLSAEDAPSDTILPRLLATGAIRRRCYFIGMTTEGDKRRLFDLQNDLDQLNGKEVSLLIIDPITAYLGKRDSNAISQVRELLAYVAEWAQRNDCAVIVISHPVKGGDSRKALHTLLGSGGFGAAPRSVFIVTEDPDDDERRLFIPVKINIAKKRKARSFTIKEAKLKTADITTSKIIWGEELDITADEAVGAPRKTRKWEEIADWLCNWMPDKWVASKKIFKAAHDEDYKDGAIYEALGKCCDKTKGGKKNKEQFYRYNSDLHQKNMKSA